MTQGLGFPFKKWWTLQYAMVCLDLNPRAILVLARLLDHMNYKSGLCNPTEETLATATNCQTRTVRTALRDLERSGLLETTKGPECPPRNYYSIQMFDGDKQAYRTAEKIGLNRRKNLAGKSENEPKKYILRKKAAKQRPVQTLVASNLEPRTLVSIRSKLERDVVAAFRSPDVGYDGLFRLDEYDLQEVTRRVHQGKLKHKDAVGQLMDLIERLLADKR